MHFLNAAALLTLPLFASAAPSWGGYGSGYGSGYASKGWEVGLFYVNWAIYGRQHFVTDLPAERLTRVSYAFANVNNQTGEIFLSDEWADLQYRYPTDVDSNGTTLYGNFNQLYKLKQKNRKLKVILSVGGWSYRSHFKPALATEAGRQKFAQTSLDLIANLGLDGFDVDWEYPEDATDAANLVDTVKRMRKLYDQYSAKYANNYHFEITISAPAGPIRYNVLDIAGMDKYVDLWNLMAFDYQGPGFSNFTGHNSNLFPSWPLPRSTDFNTKQAVDHYKSRISDSHKLVLGLPMYGRSFANVVPGMTHGLGQKFNGSGDGTWEAGVLDYKALPVKGSTVYTDRQTVASWSFDNATKQFVTFDTPEVQKMKAQYLQAEGLGGAWWWDSSSDRTDDKSLVTTVSNYLGGPSRISSSQNCLNYPISKYDNIRVHATNSTSSSSRN